MSTFATARSDTTTPRLHLTVARFLLAAPVLPLATDTIRVAEAFRDAAMSQFRRWCVRNPDLAEPFRRADRPEQFASPTLSGKQADGTIRKEHQHAFYLPTAEGDDQRWLTHVTVIASDGFGPGEIAALNAVRSLKLKEDPGELRVQLVGLGSAGDFRAPLLEEATVWVSATPFVVTRYPKVNGTKRDQPEDYASPRAFAQCVLRQELQRRGITARVASIEEVDCLGKPRLRPLQFQRFRSKRGDDGGRRPSGAFRLTFASPVPGPLCLGHWCHFGLGLFVPAELGQA
jgi:CRISPR-associated protein Csb2